MAQEETGVLVVGGGPTGLTAARLLAGYGVPVVLAERHPGTAIHPRARGLNVRTMEVFRTLGLEEVVRRAGAALAASRYVLVVETLAGPELRRVPDPDLLPLGERLDRFTPCDWCQCAQDELEPILAQAARAAGADLRFGIELEAFTQEAEGVTARLVDANGGGHTVRARYLIGADGADSMVRSALGITMAEGHGFDPLGHYLNIYFRADLTDLVRDRVFGGCYVENPAAEGVLLPVNNRDRWLFNIPYDPARGQSPADFPAARCTALVRQAIGCPELPVEILSVLPWEAAARVSERFQVGRVFLAGDAAHLTPPAGAFGLNTGVQDAHNLSWKLAAVWGGTAGAGLAATYEAERAPVARLAVGVTMQALDTPAPDAGAAAHAGAALPPEHADPLSARLLPILGYRYASTAVGPDLAAGAAPPPGVPDLTGRPGTRVPHRWLRYTGIRLSTIDVCDGDWVLLAGPDGIAWRTAAEQAAAALGLTLHAYRIMPAAEGAVALDDVLDLVEDRAVGDEQRGWAVTAGIGPAGALLVRPDGYVAWRAPAAAAATSAALTGVLHGLLGQ